MDTKLQPTHPNKNSTVAPLLGVLAALLIVSVLTGFNTQLPLINTDMGAFLALSVLGIGMCTTGGIGVAIEKRGWKDGVTIIGGALGILALALIVAVIFGVRLPFTSSPREAFQALAAIGVVKVIIEAIDHLRK